MFAKNNKIAIRQLQALLVLDLFGTAIITLPRRTATTTGQDGWITVLIGSVFMAFWTFVLCRVGKRHPHRNFPQLFQTFLPLPLSLVVAAGLLLKLIAGAGLELRIFCEIVKQTMLFNTPIWATSACMLLVCAYVAANGFECRGRVAEILFVLVVIPFFILLLLTMTTADFNNLRPMFTHSTREFSKGIGVTILSFQGLEFLLLVYPYLREHQQADKNVFYIVLFTAVLMTTVTVLAIATFGEISVKSKLFPVLQMMDRIDFPGAFMDRQDVFILWFWVVSSFASVSAAVFFSSVLLRDIFPNGLRYRRSWLYLCVPIIFIASVFPSDLVKTYEYLEWLKKYPGVFYIFIVPVIILLVDYVRGGKKDEIS